MTRITNEAGSRLIGALIGLVRATDGMVNVTDDTNNIIIEGLHKSDIAFGSSDADMETMIARAHADKHTIVPDCSVCGAPCGRTADYDWESVYRENPSVISDIRIAILSRLQNIAHRVVSGEINADGDVNFNVCRAVFALGENWSAGELESVERELEEWTGKN